MIEQLIKYQQWRTGQLELSLDDLGLSPKIISECIHWAIGLKAEHDALKAQVSALINTINAVVSDIPAGAEKSQLLYVRDATPNYCMADHDAEVAKLAIVSTLQLYGQEDLRRDEIHNLAERYANQLRAKAGE